MTCRFCGKTNVFGVSRKIYSCFICGIPVCNVCSELKVPYAPKKQKVICPYCIEKGKEFANDIENLNIEYLKSFKNIMKKWRNIREKRASL